MGMGQTSENVVEKYGITRKQQDQIPVESHAKAYKAQQDGLFDSEIVPVKTTVLDKEGNSKEVTVTKDDGIRKETTLESLGKLKPAFRKNGSTTAGNSSQVTDGAAAVVLARRSTAEKLGLPILATFVQYAVKGCPPEIMGIGPAVAIPELLNKVGMKVEDIDIWELNEAFASQATYSIERLGIPKEKLNPKGGAIALGHPLGCTGKFILISRFKTNCCIVTRAHQTKQKIRCCFDVRWYRNGSRCSYRQRMIKIYAYSYTLFFQSLKK